jgi:hypothetical protein
MEEEFEHEVWASIEESLRFKPPYNPTVFINMVRQHGAVKATQLLLVSGDIQTGFDRLIREGRQDLTVEHMVLRPEYQGLFTDQHREAARWRLKQVTGGL